MIIYNSFLDSALSLCLIHFLVTSLSPEFQFLRLLMISSRIYFVCISFIQLFFNFDKNLQRTVKPPRIIIQYNNIEIVARYVALSTLVHTTIFRNWLFLSFLFISFHFYSYSIWNLVFALCVNPIDLEILRNFKNEETKFRRGSQVYPKLHMWTH